jgi:hypothetical protein
MQLNIAIVHGRTQTTRKPKRRKSRSRIANRMLVGAVPQARRHRSGCATDATCAAAASHPHHLNGRNVCVQWGVVSSEPDTCRLTTSFRELLLDEDMSRLAMTEASIVRLAPEPGQGSGIKQESTLRAGSVERWIRGGPGMSGPEGPLPTIVIAKKGNCESHTGSQGAQVAPIQPISGPSAAKSCLIRMHQSRC